MAKVVFGSKTSRNAWLRLTRGITIVFLLTHQTWAGILCHCLYENTAQHASQMAHSCCPLAHHSSSGTSTECAGESADSSPTEELTPGADHQLCGNQFGALSQNVRACCHSAPQTDAQEMTI